jgi:hypothetical protein
MSRISRAMLLRRVDARVDEPQQSIDVMTISLVIGPLGFLAVGQALQHVSMSACFSRSRSASPRARSPFQLPLCEVRTPGKRNATRFQRTTWQPSFRPKRALTE